MEPPNDRSRFAGNTVYVALGNVVSDPEVTDAAAGDFTRRAGHSPAIDAGDPKAEFGRLS